MLSTPGIGSGLDISSIIDQLMTIESQPLVQLGVEEIELQAQLSAFGTLKSTVSTFSDAMSELSDADKFKVFKVTSSDEDVLTAAADSTTAKGTFGIEVTRIAENHRLAATTVFADTDTTKIGNPGDTMTITVGATAFVVDIGGKTLDERSATPSTPASDNAGVTASTLQDDDGFHLTLSADETGSASFVGVTYSGVDPFTLASLNSDRDLSGTFTRADLDAVLTIENAFTVTRSSNTVSDVIQGVTLNLEQTGTTTIDIERDDDKIIGAVEQFIAAYNDVVSTIDELTANVLSTDRASLTNLEAQFRAVLNTAAIRRCSRAPSRAIPSASPISSRTAPTVWQYGWRTLPIPSSPPVGSSTVASKASTHRLTPSGTSELRSNSDYCRSRPRWSTSSVPSTC